MTVYDGADRAIRALNRENLKAFGRLKVRLMKADELHIIREVTEVYDSALRLTERWFLEVARQAYAKAMQEAGKRKRNAIDRDWLLDYLEETEPVALYRFIPEWDRKKARLIEALAATPDRGREIDRALKALTRQIGWFAVAVTDAARNKAFEDASVSDDYGLQWHAEHDDRTCKTCHRMDGKIYRIGELPDKPHLGCRCWWTLVKTDSERETA